MRYIHQAVKNSIRQIAFFLLGVKNDDQINTIISIINGDKWVRDYIDEYMDKYFYSKRKFFELNECTTLEIELGKIAILAKKGLSQKKIADEIGIPIKQVRKRCKRYGIKTIGMKNEK